MASAGRISQPMVHSGRRGKGQDGVCARIGQRFMKPTAFSFHNGSVNGIKAKDIPAFICEKVNCSAQYFPAGYTAGRQDIIHKYGTYLLFLIVLLAFAVNHVVYMIRGKHDKV